jgi:RNA polymerase sigma factor (sigma-70 family)
MKFISEDQLLKRLKAGDSLAFSVLYDRCFPSVETYVLNNSGTLEDAEDLFQEGILVFHKKLQSDSFTLSSPISAYIFSVVRNMWLNQLRTRRQMSVQPIEQLAYELIAQEHSSSKGDKLNEWLQKVTDHCQWILNGYYFMQMPLELLMQKMGWKNKHTASNQKYKCIQMLKKQIATEA